MRQEKEERKKALKMSFGFRDNEKKNKWKWEKKLNDARVKVFSTSRVFKSEERQKKRPDFSDFF